VHRRTNTKPERNTPNNTALTPPEPSPQPGRDAAGRWLPGIRSPNPSGRPRDTVSGMIRSAISDQLTPDKVEALARTLINQAVNGDPKAREHLLAFFGVNLRTLDIAMAADNKVEIRVVYADQEDRDEQDVLPGEYSVAGALGDGAWQG